MSSGRVLKINNLEEWQRGLLEMGGPGAERMKDRVVRSAGLRTLEYLDDLTPVRTGRLKDSMTMGDKDNVFEIQVGGRNSFVFVGTAVKYAAAVNDGHEQKKGRFVPGYWDGATFVYEEGSKEGMVLTGKVIPGARMFEKSMDYMEDDLKTILDFEFRRLYRELFG